MTTLDLLKAQEWTRVETGGGSGGLSPMTAYVCRSCGAEQHQGHADNCSLSLLLREFEHEGSSGASPRLNEPCAGPRSESGHS